MNPEDLVYFVCVKDGSRLRVRITSQGYRRGANCQFPRNIRKEGQQYKAPASAVTLAQGIAGKYFYRVKKSSIEIVDTKIVLDKIFKDPSGECVVCMDASTEVVIVPCGHFCLCKECADILVESKFPKCPLCRGDLQRVVPEDQIQT